MFHVKHFYPKTIKPQDYVSRETYKPLYIVILTVKHLKIISVEHQKKQGYMDTVNER